MLTDRRIPMHHKLDTTNCIRLAAKAQINGSNVDCLVDSGANVNVISMKFIEQLGVADAIEPGLVSCSAFDGSTTASQGRIKLDVMLGKENYSGYFTVLPRTGDHAVILGAPFLQKTGILESTMASLNKICGPGIIKKDF